MDSKWAMHSNKQGIFKDNHDISHLKTEQVASVIKQTTGTQKSQKESQDI